ncbi:hypothetical protein [Desulforamulus ferrireducens]|uniref:Uncharacterized protein n=1 Tax=Desulforamulus ferrireducens TaxID=1833852 RepID=A0A1S6ITS5_9FIRM|nr:hypothetical protein [Desulforamulus ferrireducens]AQS58176.1 hypothetical protein B0537_03145 [Desulforamulus ferrireducens]
MEKLFEKLKEYLNMDTEISYEEFEAYYQDVISLLNAQYQELNKEETIHGRFILSIIMSNAEERAKNYKSLAKKYKKIYNKCQIWAEALTLRLLKMGMTKDEIIQAEKDLHDSV